ncbi:MAG: hypothetical protein AAGA48_20775 [Myxococcota bacterium]
MPVPLVRHSLDDIEAAETWIRELYAFLPNEARPPTLDDATYLRQMASYFSSYLLVSFELRDNPGQHLAPLHGCLCPLCARLVRASALRPRRLGSRAKRAATEASAHALMRVARHQRQPLDAARARTLVSEFPLRRDAALVAYIYDLAERIEGRSGDEHSLALWRRFAYTPTGAPIRTFALSVEVANAAYAAVVHALSR